jgi:hypothetical protein
MWRTRLKVPDAGEMQTAHRRREADGAEAAIRQDVWADLQRVMGRDTAQRIVEAAAALAREPKPEEPAPADTADLRRDVYFQPGSYSQRSDSEAEGQFLEWRRRATGHESEAWEESSPDPNVRLDLWVARELTRAGLPAWLGGVVVRMAMVTMRDGVEAARRTLLEERCVPEQYHFAIDGILKLIPPSI